jgi:hypothetical protein
MDPNLISMLATNTLNALQNYWTIIATKATEKIGEELPTHIGKIWTVLRERSARKPSTQEALADLIKNPNEPDLQAAFRVQLRKMLEEDRDFAEELKRILGTAETQATYQATQSEIGKILIRGTGNVVTQNQKGGIAAHTINVNEAIAPEWTLNPSEKIGDNEWRAKLSARARGRLPYFNWNILLTLNTEVIRREDVPGEVTVGPWIPLGLQRGKLQGNHFFIGFSEFKPGQGFAIYLYSKEPLKVLRVDILSE